MIFFLLSLAERGNVDPGKSKVNWNPYDCFTSSRGQYKSRIFTNIYKAMNFKGVVDGPFSGSFKLINGLH